MFHSSLITKLVVLALIVFEINGYIKSFLPDIHLNKIHKNNKKYASKLFQSYFDDISIFKSAEKKCLIGFTTDTWNIGQKKYRNFLAANKMVKRIQKMNFPCVEMPLWEIANGPHFDDLQRLFESYWVPDMTSSEHFLLQYDLVVVPDQIMAKYMVEAYYEKEAKIEKKKQYYNKLMKQPWGVIEAYPPREKYEWQKIKNLSKQRWISKFPPLATCDEDVYRKLRHFGQVQYFSRGVEDFALHLPNNIVPNRRVLLLRYRNKYETLVQSLVLRGINVTSAYPVTWAKKEWSPQEDRLAREVDVVYFHEVHALQEWRQRLGNNVRDREVVVACHDMTVAKAAKTSGFRDVFYAKIPDSDGLTKTVLEAIDHAKTLQANSVRPKQ